MKREFLENLDLGNGIKLSKENIETIMAEFGKTKTTLDNQINTLTTERDGLKTQLDAAGKEIQSYKDMDIDGIKNKVGEWETKYNNDTKALKEQLESANYNFAVKEAVSGLKFTSESAKKAFILDLTNKNLPLQDGKILGLEDFTKNYKEGDPGAFVSENNSKTPMWSRGAGVDAASASNIPPFGFKFTGIRARNNNENKGD